MTGKPATSMSLYTVAGCRKYLTASERRAFLSAAQQFPREVRTFCGVLTYTGCRLSEALALTADRVDLIEGVIVLETLKKREPGIYREVPVPSRFLDAVDLVHGIREAQRKPDGGRNRLLWSWSRMTAWRRVQAVMKQAGIQGPQATPNGLRHGFGAAAVRAGIPLTLVQKWLGHAHLSTTAVYTDAIDVAEKTFAARMWEENDNSL